MHDERRVADGRMGEDADGIAPVRPAAAREGGVAQGHAHVEGDGGVEAEGLGEAVLEVAHGLEVRVGRGATIGAEVGGDFGPEAGDDGWVAGELVEEPREGGGGGVAPREQDGDELVADDGAIAREAGQGVQEGVAGIGAVFLVQLGGGEVEGAVDVRVYEGVDGFEGGVEAAAGDEAVHGSAEVGWLVVGGRVGYAEEGGGGREVGSPGAGDDVLHTLHFGKGFGELGLRVAEAVDARAKEEVGCCVQRVSVFGVAYISPCPLDIVLCPPPPLPPPQRRQT